MTAHLSKGFVLGDLAHPRDLLEFLFLLRSIEAMDMRMHMVSQQLALCSLYS